jgi:sulfur-oxidizing protein SoxZ
MNAIRIAAPKTAREGEVIELKAMIQHAMESGYRRDQFGRQIPRDILKHFECHYDDEVVFRAEFFPGVAANPFLSFYTTATRTGTLLFRWVDQGGQVFAETVQLEVK